MMTASAVFLTVVLVCLLSNLLLSRVFEDYAQSQQSARISDISESLGMFYDSASGEWDTEAIHAIGMYSMSDGYIIEVKDSDGVMIWDARNHDMSRCENIMDEIASRMAGYAADGGFVRQTVDITNDNVKIGTVDVTSYGPFFFSESDERLIRALNHILVVSGLVALAIAVTLGIFMARRIANPVKAASVSAKRIAAAEVFASADGERQSGIAELDELTMSVASLAEDIARQKALRKRLTEDMAHELRTPLAAILVQLESIACGAANPTPERLANCAEELKRLAALVDELEKLEASESRVPVFESIDVAALVSGLCLTWESACAAKHIRLEFSNTLEEDTLAPIESDTFSGAVSNILSNAVKYTPEGGTVSVSVRQDKGNSETGSHIIVVISDTGAGIPDEELPYIFERLYRADRSRNRKTGGAGIGLAVAYEAIQRHGGSIEAGRSSSGGAKFTIRIPKNL